MSGWFAGDVQRGSAHGLAPPRLAGSFAVQSRGNRRRDRPRSQVRGPAQSIFGVTQARHARATGSGSGLESRPRLGTSERRVLASCAGILPAALMCSALQWMRASRISSGGSGQRSAVSHARPGGLALGGGEHREVRASRVGNQSAWTPRQSLRSSRRKWPGRACIAQWLQVRL